MLPDRLRGLTYLLARLPGVGEKTAQRFALHFVAGGAELAKSLGQALTELDGHLRGCERCGNIAEVAADGTAVCRLCRDEQRGGNVLCVVARVQDLLAIERSGAMQGRYQVLGRLLSPLDGIGPEELPLAHLRRRIEEESFTEVVLATPPSVDGEATALFLARELRTANVKLTRIASGIPHGGDLEFADQITLGRALSGRRNVDAPTK